jgi:hypothetical protein
MPNEYKIDKDKDALDYKVRIESSLKKSYNNFEIKKMGAYFGELTAIELTNIKITIISFNVELLKMIEELFAEFILITNFGTRQNKGFGNFTVESINGKKINLDNKNILEKYFIILNEFDSENSLRDIAIFYQNIKSGNSRNKTKSALMSYFYPKIRWEKRWIKKELKKLNIDMFNDLKDEYHKNNKEDFNDTEKYKYIRALLGIAGSIEFLTYKSEKLNQEAKNKKDQIDKENDRTKNDKLKLERKKLLKQADDAKIKITIEHNETDKDKKIERFASPISFIVISNKVFVVLPKEQPINRLILGKKFKFTASYKNGDEMTELSSLEIPIMENEKLLTMYQEIFKSKHKTKIKKQEVSFNNPFAKLKDLS